MANRAGRPRDLKKIGVKHGRLTIVKDVYLDDLPAWECLCECGAKHVVKNRDLRNTRSCGCLRADLGKENKTHGMALTPTYQAWHAMKQRCLNPKHRAWKNYGGRGITVCDRWANSFENFYADMGDKPKNHSLERKDNNKGYLPENCCWATSKMQASNRRTNRRFQIGSEMLTLAEMSQKSGLSPQALSWRMYKLNMLPAEAISTPLLRSRRV